MQFTYQAMTRDGQTLCDGLEAASSADAADALRAKGLTVLRLRAERAGNSRPGPRVSKHRARGVHSGDLVLFTRQMKMLLEAGSALVPALQAIEEQTAKPGFADLVQKIRQDVEQGGTLSEAFRERPDIFKPVFCSMVAAGEATASLPESFHRLNELAVRQQQVRRKVIGALVYPAILSVLCAAVAGVVLGFVVPRFTGLFNSLNSPLPTVTRVLFAVSEHALAYWPVGAGALVAAVLGLVIMFKVRQVRRRFDTLILSVPVVGRIASRLIFARVLRVWAAMLRCHVPLLEAIQHSRSSLTNTVFIGLVRDISSGSRIRCRTNDSQPLPDARATTSPATAYIRLLYRKRSLRSALGRRKRSTPISSSAPRPERYQTASWRSRPERWASRSRTVRWSVAWSSNSFSSGT